MTVESIGIRRRIVRTYPTSLERAWALAELRRAAAGG